MGEAGLKDFISDTWNATRAPPKTPAPIVAKLNAAVNEVLKVPEVQEQYRKLHLQAGGGTPAGHGEDHQGRHRALGRGDQGSQDSADLVAVTAAVDTAGGGTFQPARSRTIAVPT